MPKSKVIKQVPDGGNRFAMAEAHYNQAEQELDRIEPAWAKAALYFRTDYVWHFGHGDDEIRMQSIVAIHHELEARRKRFEAGDSLELLHAIKMCADENLPLPTWLVRAFNARLAAFNRIGGPASLDTVFTSAARPTGTPAKAEKARQDWQTGGLLWRAVWQVADKHIALDPAIDEVLASGAFNVKATKAKRLVSMIDKTHCELTGQPQLSQFLRNRRKQFSAK